MSRLIWGARISLLVGLGCTTIGLVVGTTLGMLAAYYKGWVDSLVRLLTDSLLAFPPLVFLLALVAVLRPSVQTLFIAFSVLTIPTIVRLARASAFRLGRRDYVLAARAIGSKGRRVMVREILPGVMPRAPALFDGHCRRVDRGRSVAEFPGSRRAAAQPELGQHDRRVRERAATGPPGRDRARRCPARDGSGLQPAGGASAAADRHSPVGARMMAATAPADAATAPLLAVEDLRTTFSTPQGPLRATDGVSFVVERGRTFGIVGESGSGKTVLARSIMGLLPTQGVERSGHVRLEGKDLMGLGRRELAKIWGDRVAMVFQDPMTSLNPVIRIGRQLTDGLHSHQRISRSDAKARALELLRSVGTPDPDRRARQYPHELSGGLRQRVTIAMALSSNPALLVADEPTTALDVTVQAQILDLLDRVRDERHMGMILVTHDLGVIAGRTDEIAVMYAGRIVERAPTRSLFANPRMPYTEALIASIARPGDVPHSPLRAIPGRPPNLARLPSGCAFAPAVQVHDREMSDGAPAVAVRAGRARLRVLVPDRIGFSGQ